MRFFYMFGIVIPVALILGGCEAFFALTTRQELDLPPTPIPTPVLLPERPETLSDIQTLLQSDGEDCQLPCFWGFRPGYSTEEEVFEFLQPVPIGNNAPELHYYFPEGPVQDSIFWLGFGVQERLVSTISVVIENPSEWLPDETLQLHRLLSMMPLTSEVYLSVNITTQRAFLDLAYDEGVLATYVFNLQTEGPSTLEADFSFCTSLSSNVLILLELREVNAQTLLEGYGILHESVQDKVWTIERMTGISPEEFTTKIIDNPDGCIDIYSYAELSEMGYEF